ncbi:hypothetical protein KQX54_014039 [Cotesia glomerata]|uniref:Uncharacterized protein n=1 Tax=Cotesia glomerata TaxID=32391 RepID=A0AAV7J6Y7_COTGL|nr:hypothetical protein KQX54_014039 [Cotesia glomerata]
MSLYDANLFPQSSVYLGKARGKLRATTDYFFDVVKLTQCLLTLIEAKNCPENIEKEETILNNIQINVNKQFPELRKKVADNILGKQKTSTADRVDKVMITEPQTPTVSTNTPEDNQLMQIDEPPETQKTANKRLHSDTESTLSTVGNENTPFKTPAGTLGILCNFMDKVINKVHPKTAAADYMVEPTQLIIMLTDLYERLQSQRAKYRFSCVMKKLGTKLADDTESNYDSQASDANTTETEEAHATL